MRLIDAIVSPKPFYNNIQKVTWKGTLIDSGIIIFVMFLFTVLRTYFLMATPVVQSLQIVYYRQLFSAFSGQALLFSIEFCAIVLVIALLFFLIVAAIGNLISRLSRKKLPFLTHLKIAVYSAYPLVLQPIIYYILTRNNVAEYQIYVTIITYLAYIVLLIVNTILTMPKK